MGPRAHKPGIGGARTAPLATDVDAVGTVGPVTMTFQTDTSGRFVVNLGGKRVPVVGWVHTPGGQTEFEPVFLDGGQIRRRAGGEKFEIELAPSGLSPSDG